MRAPPLAIVFLLSTISWIPATASSSSTRGVGGNMRCGYQGGGGDDEISMGTTILAVQYNGGVITGANTRTSSNVYVT